MVNIDVLVFLSLVSGRFRCFFDFLRLSGQVGWRHIMGGTARQFNKMYSDYKKRFKKPIANIALFMPQDFTDDLFVNTFIIANFIVSTVLRKNGLPAYPLD